MSIFSNLSNDNLEQQKDSLGGFSVLDSGSYDAKITAAYVTTSAKGAMAINLVCDIDGREYREQLWITNSKGENYFINKKTNSRVPLPGFTIVNDICLCTVGSDLKELDTTPRVFKIYDYDTKQEMPKEVPTITDLMGKEITLGILKQIVDKNVKNDAGDYVPSGETREENVIDKVFHCETKMTVNEAKDGKKEASFHAKWLAKNEGQVRNRSKGAPKAEGTAGAPKKATKSLFG